MRVERCCLLEQFQRLLDEACRHVAKIGCNDCRRTLEPGVKYHQLTFLPCYKGLDVKCILAPPIAVRQHLAYQGSALVKLLQAAEG